MDSLGPIISTPKTVSDKVRDHSCVFILFVIINCIKILTSRLPSSPKIKPKAGLHRQPWHQRRPIQRGCDAPSITASIIGHIADAKVQRISVSLYLLCLIHFTYSKPIPPLSFLSTFSTTLMNSLIAAEQVRRVAPRSRYRCDAARQK